MPRRSLKKTSSTHPLDAWIQQTLKHRAEVEEWCQQNNIPYKKPETASANSKESGVHHADPVKIPDWLVRKRAAAPRKPAASDVSAETRLSELLEILWADDGFWQSVHDADHPFEICYYISRKYGLRFPEIPIAAWREAAFRPGTRDRLFRVHHDEREISFDGGSDFSIVWCALQSKLPETKLGELFWEFLYEPALDHRHVVASRGLSIGELEALRLAVLRFANDLEWCAVNHGVVPPQFAPNRKQRPFEVENARIIETMVQRLVDDPALSDIELAKFKPSDKAAPHARRKLAAKARRLVELREGKVVKRYSEERNGHIIGRKPSRRRKAAER